MSEEELLSATLATAGPRQVPPGKVRRKRGGTRGMAELVALKHGA